MGYLRSVHHQNRSVVGRLADASTLPVPCQCRRAGAGSGMSSPRADTHHPGPQLKPGEHQHPANPLILLSQNRQADTDRIEAERDYEVNQRALRYLTILHRDAHGEDCECVERAGPGGEDFSVGWPRPVLP